MSSWQTKPGNNTKGWNDPPMFIYGPNANLQPSRRNVLTKRVAFPVDENSGYSTQYASQQNYYQSHNPYPNQPAPQQGYSGYYYHNEPTTLMEAAAPTTPQNFHLLPPSTYPQPPSYHGPVVVPTMPVSYSNHAYEQTHHVTSTAHPTAPYRPGVAKDPMSELPVAAIMDDSDLQVPNFADDEQMYHYCVTRLQRALNECRTTTEERLINEMQKKLNVFSEMWKSGKISYVVKSTMCKIATAIHRRKYSIANELHLVLMMDHISEVSKWLVGIKKLVQEVEKAPQHPTSPSVSCSYDNPTVISQDLNHQPLSTFETVPASIINTSSIHPSYADVMTANSISLQPTVNNVTTVNNFYPPNADVITTSNHFYNDVAAFNTPHTYDHFHIENTNAVQQVTDNLMGLNITQVASYREEPCNPSIDQHNPRLSCSPPTFDPAQIDQCFNDHGELLLKFVDDDDDQNNNKARGDKSPVGHFFGSVHEDLKPVGDDDPPNHRNNLPNTNDLVHFNMAESHKDEGFPCQPIKGDFNLSDDAAPFFEEIDLMSDRGVESSTNNEVNGY